MYIFKDLRLREEGRELVYKGNLKRRGGQGDSGDLQLFLFDHALLMVKTKDKNKHEMYKVYRRVCVLFRCAFTVNLIHHISLYL